MPTLTTDLTTPIDTPHPVDSAHPVDSVGSANLVDSVDSAHLVDSVDGQRALIDDLDERLIALLAERRAVSRRIQQLRVDAGGSRVEHSRENVVIRRWATSLGDGGADLALAVLRHCRG